MVNRAREAREMMPLEEGKHDAAAASVPAFACVVLGDNMLRCYPLFFQTS